MTLIAYPATWQRFLTNTALVTPLVALPPMLAVTLASGSPATFMSSNSIAFIPTSVPIVVLGQGLFIAAHRWDWARWWLIGSIVLYNAIIAIGCSLNVVARDINSMFNLLMVSIACASLLAPCAMLTRKWRHSS